MSTFNTHIKLYQWIKSFTDLVFPPACPACKNPLTVDEEWLCINCEFNLPLTPYLLQSENPISSLFKGRLNLEFGSSLLLYTKNGIAQKLIHELKYSKNTAVGVKLGELLGAKLKGKITLPNAVIPIPLHPNKEKKRGYNQSLFIAKGLAKSLNIHLDDTLIKRVIENPSQTKLNRYKRWENVESIFSAKGDINYNYVWIVDDTLTTGSTIEACATTLLKNKNMKIGVITLAYAY